MARDTILDAWCKGYTAAQDGAPVTQNPYPQGTKLAEVWARALQKCLDAQSTGLPAPPLVSGHRWGW